VGVRKKEARLDGRHPFRHIMLALFETPAGFALFKVLNEGKLDNAEELWKEFETPEVARKMVKLKAFDKFESTTDALNAATHLVDSKLPKGLRKFLKAQCKGQTLVVADSKLGKAISDKLVCMGFFSLSFFPPDLFLLLILWKLLDSHGISSMVNGL
jgi:predicted DNA-binding WGR domain protein